MISNNELSSYLLHNNPSSHFNYYKVEKGDTLYKIAKKYNINPVLLMNLNGISKDDYIYPEQMIIIPKQEYSYYLTEEGDTIQGVANVFGIDRDELLNQNKTIYLMANQILVNKK